VLARWINILQIPCYCPLLSGMVSSQVGS
jgi:hypothetical protein